MGIRVNFADAPEGQDFDTPIPSGKYLVTVSGGEIKESGPKSKNPGAEYINWELTVAEGEHQGRKLWAVTSLLPHAIGYGLKPLLHATGKFNVDGELDFSIDEVVNSQVIAKVRIEAAKDSDGSVIEGEFRNVVKGFLNRDAGSAGSTADSKLP